jgi:hypothetical protein
MGRHLVQVSLLLMLGAASPALPQSDPKTGAKTDSSGSLIQPQLSPGAAYQQAMEPVVITRHSIANWSDAEQFSLAVAVKEATVACADRSADKYSGEELVDLGRLCALGLAWPAALNAVDHYLQQPGANKTGLSEAYAIKLDAQLHLKDEPSALKTVREMLSSVPYDSFAAYATGEAIDYMRLRYTSDAVSLAAARQPKMLALLQAFSSADSSRVSSPEAVKTAPDLYRQALVLAELQQLAADPDAARNTIAALDNVVPSTLADDDVLAIKDWKMRYALLGQPLMLTPLSSLSVPAQMPVIPARKAITALLLFPDWCAQCIQLARQMPKGKFSVEGHEAYIFGLLVNTMTQKLPSVSSLKSADEQSNFNPAYAEDYLKGSSTVTVPASLLKRFNAHDVPVLIVTDSNGIIRFIDVADEAVLQPGGTVDSAVDLIGKQWPTTIGIFNNSQSKGTARP